MVAAVAHIQGVKREVQLLQPKKHVRDLDFTKKTCYRSMHQIDTNGNQLEFWINFAWHQLGCRPNRELGSVFSRSPKNST